MANTFKNARLAVTSSNQTMYTNSSGGTATCDSTSFNGNGANYPNSSTSYQIRAVSGTGAGQDMQWINTATWRVN